MGCDDKDLLAAATLQSLLGGGDQFSAGGPGKGLTSRIFTRILHHPEVLSANSFNVSYADAGLFGIQVPARPPTAAPRRTPPRPSEEAQRRVDEGV